MTVLSSLMCFTQKAQCNVNCNIFFGSSFNSKQWLNDDVVWENALFKVVLFKYHFWSFGAFEISFTSVFPAEIWGC